MQRDPMSLKELLGAALPGALARRLPSPGLLAAWRQAVGEGLARALGIGDRELAELSRLAEAIPSQPLDADGFLRLGIREGGGWRHDLDPLTMRDRVASLSPQAQKLLMAYVEPAEGFHVAPRLAAEGAVAGPGVNLGRWSLEKLAGKTGLDAPTLGASLAVNGRNGFVAGLGGDDPLARLWATRAAEYLENGGYDELGIKPFGLPGDDPGRRGTKAADQVAQARPKEEGGEAPPPTMAGDMRVPVPEWVFGWVGAKPGKVYADYRHLQAKHPDQFKTPEAARAHVEYVLGEPTFKLPASDPRYDLLIRSNGGDKAAVVEFELRGGKYRVRSAYRFDEGQLAVKIAKAKLMDPGGSRVAPAPARSPRGEISAGSPVPPFDGHRQGPSTPTIGQEPFKDKPWAGDYPGEKKAATSDASPLREPPTHTPEANRGPSSGETIAREGGKGKPGGGDSLANFLGLQDLYEAGEGLYHRLAETLARNPAPEVDPRGEILLPHPARPPFRAPSTISREAAHREGVRQGLLAPGQRVEGYVTHMAVEPRELEAARLGRRAVAWASFRRARR